MENMLSEKMIANIEALHAMSKEEVFKEYEEIHDIVIPEGTHEDKIKLERAFLIYAVMYGREPCEITKDAIYNYFQDLKIETTPSDKKMEDTLNEKATKQIEKTLSVLCDIYKQLNGSAPSEKLKDKTKFWLECLDYLNKKTINSSFPTKNIAYILTNPSLKGWVKIGFTDGNDINDILNELNDSPAIPSSFSVYATLTIEKLQDVERHIHKLFDLVEPSLNFIQRLKNGEIRMREFFQMSSESAYMIFKEVAEIINMEDGLTLYAMNEKAKTIDKISETNMAA